MFPVVSATTTGDSYTPANVSGRIVSVGASLEFVGTNFNLGGTISMYCGSMHENVASYLPSAIPSFVETLTTSISREKQWLTTSGVNDVELEYTAYSQNFQNQVPYVFPYSNSQFAAATTTVDWSSTYANLTACGAPCMVIVVNAPQLSSGGYGCNIMVEIVQHVEYTGVATTSLQTPTHSDSVGFEMVNNAAQRMYQSRVANPREPLGSIMLRNLKDVARELIPVGKNLVVSYLTSRAGLGSFRNIKMK